MGNGGTDDGQADGFTEKGKMQSSFISVLCPLPQLIALSETTIVKMRLFRCFNSLKDVTRAIGICGMSTNPAGEDVMN